MSLPPIAPVGSIKVPAIVDDPASSVAAFVGPTASGPSNIAVPVGGFADFIATFGAVDPATGVGDAVRQYFLNGGTSAFVVRVASGANVHDATIGQASSRTGLHALDAVDFGLLALPGLSDAPTIADAAAYVATRRAFLLVDPPVDATTVASIVQRTQAAGSLRSPDAALYFPWLSILDPLAVGGHRSIAPSGSIAGSFARGDSAHGIWKSPSGIDQTLAGVDGPVVPITDADNATLGALAVNAIRRFPSGTVAWGARTMAGGDDVSSDWRYVPVRRMALHLERSIARGLSWTVRQTSTSALWTQVTAVVETYLHGLWLRGAFQGSTTRQAFVVRCDATTMTSSDLANGVVDIVVGFAPSKPAEFVVLRISAFASTAKPPPSP